VVNDLHEKVDFFEYTMKIIKKGQTNPFTLFHKQSLWTYLITGSKMGYVVSLHGSFF